MINKILQKRKSVYAFSLNKIEKETIESLFEAARIAPSSSNMQPWRYIYGINGTSEFQKLFETLTDSNKRWVKDAPLLILSLAQVEYEYNGKIVQNKYAWHDTGLANMSIIIQAIDMGMVVHPMGGFNSETVKVNFSLPNVIEPLAMIAVGYPGKEIDLPEDLILKQNAIKSRKNINEIILYKSAE